MQPITLSGAGPSAVPVATPTLDWGPALPLPSDPITLSVGPFSISIDIVKWVLQAVLGFLQWIIQAIVGGIMALIGPFFDPSSPYYLLSTPHLLTDQNAGVLGFIQGGTGWAALAALAVIVLLGGYNIMVRLHLGLPYHTLMEFVPRLALGAVGSVVIVAVIGGLIDLVNGLDQLGVAQIQTTFQWPDPQTQRWTQFWLNAFLGAMFVQPLQVLAIALGTTLMTSFGSQPSVWGMIFQLGVGIAAFWLAWRMPRLVDSWAVRFSIGSVGSPLDLFGVGGGGGGGGGGGDAFLGAVPGGDGGPGAPGSPGGIGGLGGDTGAAGGGGGAGMVVDGEVVSSTIVGGDLAETVPLLLLA